MKKTAFFTFLVLLIASAAYPQPVQAVQNSKQYNESPSLPGDNLPEQTEMAFAEAVMLSTEGDYDGAILKYQDLLTNQVRDKYIYYSLLETYSLKAGKIGQSRTDDDSLKAVYTDELNYSREALNLYSNDLKLLYFYADSTRNLGMAEEYVNVLNRILSIDDSDVFANYYIGDYYFVNKQNEQAAFYFQKVLASMEDNKEFDLMAKYRSLYSLGIIAIVGGDYQDAIQFLERAKNIYSKDYELIKTLAMTYAGALQFRKAAENFDSIPEEYKNEEVQDVYYGVLFAMDQKALKDILKNKTPARSHFLWAVDYYTRKEFDKSVRELDLSVSERKSLDYYQLYLYYLDYKASGNRGKVFRYAFMLGNKSKEAGEIDLAIGYYKILLSNSDSIPSVYWLIGSLYDDKNDYRNAAVYYNKYLSNKDGEEYKIQALIRISDMYYRQTNINEAAKMLSKARNLAAKKSDQFQVFFYSGLIQFENKMYSNAVNDFNDAMKADGKEAKLYYYLGTSYFELADYSNAINTLEAGIKYDSRS
ncbi:MAG: tetratricopeptide repeat protein, partial [Brevinematales bacterium]